MRVAKLSVHSITNVFFDSLLTGLLSKLTDIITVWYNSKLYVSVIIFKICYLTTWATISVMQLLRQSLFTGVNRNFPVPNWKQHITYRILSYFNLNAFDKRFGVFQVGFQPSYHGIFTQKGNISLSLWLSLVISTCTVYKLKISLSRWQYHSRPPFGQTFEPTTYKIICRVKSKPVRSFTYLAMINSIKVIWNELHKL